MFSVLFSLKDSDNFHSHFLDIKHRFRCYTWDLTRRRWVTNNISFDMITLSFHRHYEVFSRGILTCFHLLVYVTIDLSLSHWISGDNIYGILILHTKFRLFHMFLSDALIKCFWLTVCICSQVHSFSCSATYISMFR